MALCHDCPKLDGTNAQIICCIDAEQIAKKEAFDRQLSGWDVACEPAQPRKLNRHARRAFEAGKLPTVKP